MDAHENEYRAAAEFLHEQTPPPCRPETFAVGDFVSGNSAGRRWAGRIEWLSDNGVDACVDVGGAWVFFPLTDITH